VTKQSQFRHTNQWAALQQSDRIIAFGSIYPHGDTYKEDIDFVVRLGLRGLKFHAEYQNFVVDDPHMLKIYDYALSKGLIVLHHAGMDPAFPLPMKSSPQQFARVAEEMQGGTIVAAHFGGQSQWEDVEKYLVGTDIFLDTSMGLEYYPHDLFMRVVRSHGADKILFGSDSPWGNAQIELEHLRSLPLTDGELEAILSGNAKRLLALS
jgi:predicted TIM-barrel fold metal-dependent hydrolase